VSFNILLRFNVLLKSGLVVTQGHWKYNHSIHRIRVENRDFFHTPPAFDAHIKAVPVGLLP